MRTRVRRAARGDACAALAAQSEAPRLRAVSRTRPPSSRRGWQAELTHREISPSHGRDGRTSHATTTAQRPGPPISPAAARIGAPLRDIRTFFLTRNRDNPEDPKTSGDDQDAVQSSQLREKFEQEIATS